MRKKRTPVKERKSIPLLGWCLRPVGHGYVCAYRKAGGKVHSVFLGKLDQALNYDQTVVKIRQYEEAHGIPQKPED
ncbi:MAG: hypothetical protein AB1641_03720 [Thermodesulfobacteriota bacterium]